ncbi:MAG: hypothetical protein AAGE52_13355 [Myxococcota bacterium]
MRVLAFLLLGACSIATEVDQYRFAESVCPPVDRCTGGDTYWYVTFRGDVAREETPGVIPGFDLDQTDAQVCGHDDFLSPTGEGGIDNRLARLLVIVETPDAMLDDLIRESYLTGEGLSVLELRNVDNFENDDCVSARVRFGFVPRDQEGDPRGYLDANGDSDLDDDLTLDYGLVTTADDTACIVDGVLQGEMSDGRVIIPFGETRVELAARSSRIRGDVSARGVDNYWLGAALDVEEIVTLLGDEDPGPIIAGILRNEADLDPNGEGVCRGLSSGLVFQAKAMTPGVLRER